LNTFKSIEQLLVLADHEFHPFIIAIKNEDTKSIENYLKTLDKETLEDGISFACIFNKPRMAVFLIDKGVKIGVKICKPLCSMTLIESYTPMGYAIYFDQKTIIDKLIEKGINIDDTAYYAPNKGALNVYFNYHYKSNPDLLKFLLEKGAKVGGTREDRSLYLKQQKLELNPPSFPEIGYTQLFKIGTTATSKELKLLLDYKLDPNITIINDQRNNRIVNLLDLVIINAENKNLFDTNDDSILKVRILIEYGANIYKKNSRGQNYLHLTTIPIIVETLCRRGVDVNQLAVFGKNCNDSIRPLDIAVTNSVIDILKKYGAKYSPYEIKNEALLENANIKQFVRQILTNKKCMIKVDENGQNILHKLFAKFSEDTVDEVNDIITISESTILRKINILIKCGAIPIKDINGCTPLMCMTFNPLSGLVNQVIRKYCPFEADYYGFDRKTFQERIFVLRNKGFKSKELFSIKVPIVQVIEQFWQSFRDNMEFQLIVTS